MRKRAALIVVVCFGLVSVATTVARAGEGQASAPQSHGDHRTRSGTFKALLGSGIEWAVFHAIQAAAAESSRRGVNIEKCWITAFESDDRLMVGFGNPDPSHQVAGCPPGPCRCFHVELTKDGRTVLGAGFSQ